MRSVPFVAVALVVLTASHSAFSQTIAALNLPADAASAHVESHPSSDASQNSVVASFEDDVLFFLDINCVECHTGNKAEAGIDLNAIRTAGDALAAGKTWLRVWDAVDSGVMPPEDAEPPTDEEKRSFIGWNEQRWMLDRTEATPAAVVMRRLNRREYDNTIRDLVGMDLHAAEHFPPDDIGFGFDNIGSALRMSPTHIERYVDAAENVMQQAIASPDVDGLAPAELIGLRTYPLPPDGHVRFDHHLSPGRYLVEFSLVRAGIDESHKPPRMLIGFGTDFRNVEAVQTHDETVLYRFWLTVVEGDNEVDVSLSTQQSAPTGLEESARAGANVSGDKRYAESDAGLHVDSMVVRGPVNLTAEQLPASHQNVLFAAPTFGDASRIEAAERIVARFTERAFRRPVEAGEIQDVMRIFHLANDHGESFERSVQIALTAVLVSPKFLFLVEPDTAADDRQLSDYELASRLSYFLWSSMPDRALLEEAERGTLHENIERQVVRMLADPKSQAFVENFVGQWLRLRDLNGVAPDEELFPGFDESLKASMRGETERFFAYVLTENRSVLELLDARYTFLNAPLAELYDIEGVSGDELRMVALSDRRRGGLLTQASVLTITSHQNRTSPVNRGQFILQQLLDTPPPPPPPDVSQLDDSPKAAETASLRERLEAHRASPECASCHRRMDPMGFALENYDPIGRWRAFDGPFEVDSTGDLPGGREFSDVTEFKTLLVDTESRKFAWCVIEKMLTYGLGRPLEANDYRTVEQIRRRLVDADYRMQEILFAIVETEAFQNRGALSTEP